MKQFNDQLPVGLLACLARGLCTGGYTDFAGVRVQIPANLNLFRLFATARVSLFRCNDLLYIHVLLCSSCNISNMRRSVSSPDETPRRELKIRRAAEYF